jgi:hypothetical protein
VGDVNGDGRADLVTTTDFDFSTDGSISVLLSVVPAISVNPTSINFGSSIMGVATASQSINVTNTGGANLVVSSISLSTGDVTEFDITQDTCTGVTVPPIIGACVIQVRYWPRNGGPGPDAAGLVINSNDPNSPSTVQLSGTAVADTIAPVVTVTRPNGGEKFFTSSPAYIRWTASDNGVISSINVWISTNSGSTYSLIPGCSNLPGDSISCAWFTPGPTSTTARIRVVATDAAGNSGMDASNANFSIVSGAGSITVTAPNTLVDWGIGSTQKITWNHNLGASAFVTIELSRDGRENWEGLANVKNTAATTGTYNWVVTGPVSPAARVRITGMEVPVGDTGNVYFTISDPYIGVIAPATTTTDFGYGTSRTQTWTTNLGALDKVNVYLSTDGGVTCGTQLAANIVATNKTLTYTVPTLGLATSAARICIQWTSNATVRGLNPVNFHVGPAYIQVTYPNVAQDALSQNVSATITWASNLGTSENVRIQLSTDGGQNFTTLLDSTPSDGTQAVVIPGPPAANCRIRIIWVKVPTLYDDSSQNFPIIN